MCRRSIAMRVHNIEQSDAFIKCVSMLNENGVDLPYLRRRLLLAIPDVAVEILYTKSGSSTSKRTVKENWMVSLRRVAFLPV
jgi:hypothetical protein